MQRNLGLELESLHKRFVDRAANLRRLADRQRSDLLNFEADGIQWAAEKIEVLLIKKPTKAKSYVKIRR